MPSRKQGEGGAPKPAGFPHPGSWPQVGATLARDLNVKGRELTGVHLATQGGDLSTTRLYLSPDVHNMTCT